jgi:hypothetical protein
MVFWIFTMSAAFVRDSGACVGSFWTPIVVGEKVPVLHLARVHLAMALANFVLESSMSALGATGSSPSCGMAAKLRSGSILKTSAPTLMTRRRVTNGTFAQVVAMLVMAATVAIFCYKHA